MFCGITNFAQADRILIYSGAKVNKHASSLGSGSEIDHDYLVFDLDTLMFSGFSYFGTGNRKSAESIDPESFTSLPVETSSKASSTYFGLPPSTDQANYQAEYGAFSGVNHLLNFGGDFDGEYPLKLSFTEINLEGNGTKDEDLASSQKGTYSLDLPLTRQSNTAGDDLDGAVDLVRDVLQKKGYVEAPQ